MFNKDNLALETHFVTIYSYDHNKEFTISMHTQVEEGTSVPAQSTIVEVIDQKEGFARLYDEVKKQWYYVEDNRKRTAYDKKTGQRLEIDYLGELKDEHTFLEPPSTDHEFIDGSWVITAEKQLEIDAREKQREREEIEQRIQFLRNEIIYLTALDEDASEEIAESKRLRAQLKAL